MVLRVLSGRGLCVGRITRLEKSYQVCVCVRACVSLSVIRCTVSRLGT